MNRQTDGAVQSYGSGGAEDVLGRRLIHLDLAIEPFCSSLELFGHRGMHCRGVVGATGSSIMWFSYSCGINSWEGEYRWVGEGEVSVASLEPFNSIKQMTRRGRHVQRGLESSSIAKSCL